MRRSVPAMVACALIAIAAVAAGRSVPAESSQVSDASMPASAAVPGSAKAYFEHARTLGFPAAGQTTPYLLRAEFTTRASSGAVTTGTYTDTWKSGKQWRREASIGDSRFVRSRNGGKWYRLDEGPDAALLQFVLTALEPLPETSKGAKDDWKLQRDLANGERTTQVWRGKEKADGTPDPQNFEAYWFNDSGELTRSYLNGLDIKRDDFQDFNGVHVARQLQVVLAGKVGMKIEITALQPLGTVDSKIFTIKGNDWRREYTTEVR